MTGNGERAVTLMAHEKAYCNASRSSKQVSPKTQVPAGCPVMCCPRKHPLTWFTPAQDTERATEHRAEFMWLPSPNWVCLRLRQPPRSSVLAVSCEPRDPPAHRGGGGACMASGTRTAPARSVGGPRTAAVSG